MHISDHAQEAIKLYEEIDCHKWSETQYREKALKAMTAISMLSPAVRSVPPAHLHNVDNFNSHVAWKAATGISRDLSIADPAVLDEIVRLQQQLGGSRFPTSPNDQSTLNNFVVRALRLYGVFEHIKFAFLYCHSSRHCAWAESKFFTDDNTGKFHE